MRLVQQMKLLLLCCFCLSSFALSAQIIKAVDTLFIAYEPNYTFERTSKCTTPWEARDKAAWQHSPYDGYIGYYSPRKVNLPVPSTIIRMSELVESKEWYLPGNYNRIVNPIKIGNYLRNKEVFLVREGEIFHLDWVSYRSKYRYRKNGELIDRSIRDTLLIDRSEVSRLPSADSIDENNYLLPISTFGEFLYMAEGNEIYLDTVNAPVDLWDLRRMFYKLQPGRISSMDLSFILQNYYVVLRDGTKYYRLHTVLSSH